MVTAQNGTYTTGADGLPELRFVRTLTCDAARLWNAVTQPGMLSEWLGTTTLSDTDLGRFEVDLGSTAPQTGLVTVCEPPHCFQVTWDDPPHPPGRLFVEVLAAEPGSQLVLTHRGVTRGVLATYEPRWTTHLNRLVEYLDGALRR